MNRLTRTRLASVETLLLLVASLSQAANTPASHSRPASNSQRHVQGSVHKTSHHRGKAVRKPRPRGQQAIDSGRARQIQEALVREHYLSGEPSAVWDVPSQDAMRRYQQDQGWQSKMVPDSRALIRLGLGPDHEHLLNPESAMTTEPALEAKPAEDAAFEGSKSTSPEPLSPARGANPAPVGSTTVPATGLPGR